MKSRLSSPIAIAILLAIVGTAVFVKILYDGKIGEASFIILFIALCLTCSVIIGFDRLKELDFRNTKATFYEVKAIAESIYAERKELHQITLSMIEYMAAGNAWVSRMAGSAEDVGYREQWLELRANQIMDILKTDPKERANLFRYNHFFRDMDNVEGNIPAINEIYNKMMEQLKSEIAEMLKVRTKS